MYTGIPDIGMPLFTAKGRTLELPISLKYHAGGNRVQEIASWVGLGWALEAGGTITRTVHGLADDLPNGYYFTGNQLYDQANWNGSQTFLQALGQESVDGEPDQFFFSFAGRSGEFVMGPTSTSPTLEEYRSVPYQKLKIEPTFTDSGITRFVITSEDGTRYTFGAVDWTQDFAFGSGGIVFGPHTGQRFASAWHLTEVRSPGGDVITLAYASYTARHRYPAVDEDYHQIVGTSCPANGGTSTSDNLNTTQRLVSITSAAHTITFAPGATLRQDALSPGGQPQEPFLDKITVATPGGTVLKVFQLEHDYSAGNRLRLTRVFEQDRNGVSVPPYVLTYNSVSLPDRFSYAIDHWGYYNGVGNPSPLPTVVHNGLVVPGASRDPDATYAQAGILTRISYPTGGYSEFVYESNDYAVIGSGTAAIQDVPNSASESADPGFPDQSLQFTITGFGPVVVHVLASQDPSDCGLFFCPYTEIVNQVRWNGAQTDQQITLNPGTYTLHASTGASSGSAQINITWTDQIIAKKKIAGGLRLAELHTADAMGAVKIQRYKYTLESDTTKSSGVVNAEPNYVYDFTSQDCSYFARSSASTARLGSGPIVSYREVLVLQGANGEYGKTRHRFRSVADAPDNLANVNWPWARSTSREWERGQEIGSTDFDAAGRPQRRTGASYTFDFSSPDIARQFRGMSAHLVSKGPGVWDVRYDEYEVNSGWAYEVSDTIVAYDTTGTSSFSTVRNLTYGSTIHLQPTEIAETNSDGTQRITRMRYAADYATGSGNPEAAALTQMQGAANMHSPVIERWVIKRGGGVDSVVQAELTSYKDFGTGQYLPYQRFALNSATPITDFSPSSVTSGSFTKDSRYLVQETANAYDAQGRITQLSDARGKVTNYQYGGNSNNAFLTQVSRAHDGSGSVDLITNLAYDGDGNLQSIQDEGGSFRYFTYDTYGRLRQIKNNSSTVVTAYGYSYSATSPNWTFNTSSPNAVVDTTFLQQSPTQQSLVTTQYLDGLGRAIQTVTQDGTSYDVAATQYDLMGRLWRSWKPYTRSSAGYDPSFTSNATSFYNAYLGQSQAKPYVETQYRADGLSRIDRVIPEYVGASPTVYALRGYGIDAAQKQEIADAVDESGKKTRTFSDVFGNDVKHILGYGAAEATTTQFASDVIGRRLKATDPRALVTSYGIDSRGLKRTKTSPDAGTVNRKYDAAGNVRYSQDANQAAQGQVYFANYDFAGRPLTSGIGAATFSALDPDAGTPPSLETTQGNWVIVRQYDAKPSTTAFPWSSFSTQITPLTLSNVSGRLAAVASKSNGAWQVSLFSYDSDGQLTTRYTYTQDNGGASVLTAVNTTVSYARDLRDAITQRALTVGSNTFNHWYDYDGRGLLWKAYASTGSTKPGTADVTYTYRPSGQVQDRQFQGGPLVPLQYTIREQLATIGDPASTSYPFSARYSYNSNGTISTAEFYSAGSPAAQKRYKYDFPSYDALNRLKSADFSGWNGSAWTSTLAYDLANIAFDASGNITTLQRYRDTGTLIDNLTYSYPSSSNRLSSVADAAGVSAESWDAEAGSFTYDANGNMLSAPSPYGLSAVTYDHRNLPTSLTSNGVTSTYRYDDAGERIIKQVGSGNREIYLLEGATTLGVVTVNGSGTPVSWYFNVLSGDKVIGRQPNSGSRSYYQSDLLGTTRSVVQGVTVVESYDYDPWGVQMPNRALGSGTKEGFTGKERDAETSLDYFGARYYMAALGRWVAPDPMGEKHPEWSAYNYVLGNPLALVDPDGRQVFVNPTFDAGMAYGVLQGVTASAVGVANAFAHPLQTAESIGALATDATTQTLTLMSLIDRTSADVHTLFHGDNFSAGAIVGGWLEGVGEGALVSIGVGAATDLVGELSVASRVGTATGEAGELARPYIRSSVRQAVEETAPRAADGSFLDPNTGQPINGKYDLGHKRGHEFWREKARAQKEGLTQKEFNERMNNPDLYQAEDPKTNRSHRYEEKKRPDER